MMRLQWLLRTEMTILTIAAGIGILGCDEPSIYKPEESVFPFSNPRITAQTVLGAPNLESSIYALYESESGTPDFRGLIDNNYIIGGANLAGQIQWQKNMDPHSYSLCPLPANNIGLTNGVISVAGMDSDGDDSPDQALLVLLEAGGAEIDSLVINPPYANILLYSVDAVTPLSFVAVGGANISGVIYPFVTTFSIGPDSTLSVAEEVVFHDVPGQLYRVVKSDPGKVNGDEFGCYVLAKEYENALGAEGFNVQAFTGSMTDSTVYGVDWTVDITHDQPHDSWTNSDGLRLSNGTLYFCGAADVEKEDNPSDGYWDAGIVGAVSVSGQLKWKNTISVSDYSDGYYGLYVNGDAVYTVGYASRYIYTSTRRVHGRALLSIFDLETGRVKYHLGFGSNDFRSGFNTLLVAGASAYCAGWTNAIVDDGGFQAWFAEINLINLPITNQANLVDLKTAGDGLKTDDVDRGKSARDEWHLQN